MLAVAALPFFRSATSLPQFPLRILRLEKTFGKCVLIRIMIHHIQWHYDSRSVIESNESRRNFAAAVALDEESAIQAMLANDNCMTGLFTINDLFRVEKPSVVV